MLCIGVAWHRTDKRKLIPLAVLALPGLYISLLASLFYYGVVHRAMTGAGQDTLEAIQSDVVWNPVRFDSRLLSVLISGKHGRFSWCRPISGFYAIPSPAPWKPVEISKYAVPQPYIVRTYTSTLTGVPLWWRWFLDACFVGGLAALALSLFWARQASRLVLPRNLAVAAVRTAL
jgi:hypothetical protein